MYLLICYKNTLVQWWGGGKAKAYFGVQRWVGGSTMAILGRTYFMDGPLYFNHCAPLTITIHPYLINELHYHNVPLQHYAAWRTHPDASLTSIIDACFTECSPESILRMLFSSMMSSGISDDNSSSNYYSEMLK